MGPFLGVMLLGIAIMLGIMGVQQLQRGYRLAAAFSIVVAVALLAAGGAILLG
jgi:hypothetical protein